MSAAHAVVDNPFLDFYRAQLVHQREAGELFGSYRGRSEQPDRSCGCRTCRRDRLTRFDSARRYSWAIPDDPAIAAIADRSPNGVVEIGAGGGYWARQLRQAGVDVIAYDPDPQGGDREGEERGWHDGTRWSEVLLGDHTSVIGHSDRTLLMVWPGYGAEWSDGVLDLYDGHVVVYVGEGAGGCTGTDRMHQILDLSDGSDCWHEPDPCDCRPPEASRFEHVETLDIPQWWGLHDRLHVCLRK